MDAVGGDGRGARARGREHRVAGGPRGRLRGAHGAALEAAPDRRARRRPGHAVHRRGAGAALLDRPPRGGRARARARGDARRARPGDPPPGQEQPPDGRLAPAPPGPRRRGDRRAEGARRLGEPDPRDRRRARGADRAPRRRRRPRRAARPAAGDARAGARLGQDGRGRARARRARRAPGDRGRARLQRAVPERARARRQHGHGRADAPERRRRCSRSPTTARGSRATPAGTGLSIVRALVRDELGGTLELRSGGGTRAEVVFPT